MRKKLFEVIECSQDDNKLSNVYDIVMMATISISLVPLAFKESNAIFE